MDTPGITAFDRQGLDELASLLIRIEPDEVHLVLSATTKARDLVAVVRNYTPCNVNRLLFTKLDETLWHGNLLNLILRTPAKITYITTGQEVPEQIEAATARTFSDRLYIPGDFKHETPPVNSQLVTIASHRKKGIAFEKDCFVANKNSDIFHRPECKSVKRINTDNIIVFDHFDEAVDRHFKPCRMCCQTMMEKNNFFETRSKSAVGGF
jgi:flagellar biosynthesis protein FlhF